MNSKLKKIQQLLEIAAGFRESTRGARMTEYAHKMLDAARALEDRAAALKQAADESGEMQGTMTASRR